LVSLAPDSPAALGLSADLELERDRPAAAKALLDQVLAGGLRGEYFASWALAAFLAGDDAALLARRAELEQSEDGQVQLMLALALARHGEPSTAAATLRAKAAAISETPLQWPRGCFASTVAATPAPLGPALKAFVASMEVAMPRADGPAKLAALEALAARLDSR
jgi:predicted Zn-dependent protease